MISAISGFLDRNKRKLLVSAGVAVSGYVALDYLKAKFSELQDRAATERAAKDNLRLRFEQNQQDALVSIMALMPKLVADIRDKFPVEQITQELQAKRAHKSSGRSTTSSTFLDGDSAAVLAASGMLHGRSKAQLWHDLKIQSLTRIFTLIYALALLVYFTRLQLSILGRKSYIASVIYLREPYVANPRNAQINLIYLKFSWWLLNEGWITLSDRVHDAVLNVFDHLNPRADLSIPELSELIGQVQYLIDYDCSNEVASSTPSRPDSSPFLNMLLPDPELEPYVLGLASANQTTTIPHELRALLDETTQFVDSQTSSDVIKRLVHSGLAVVVSTTIAQLYADPDTKVKLASVLANLTRQTAAMAVPETPFQRNEYISAMTDLQELNAFSAIVYSHFDLRDLGQ